MPDDTPIPSERKSACTVDVTTEAVLDALWACHRRNNEGGATIPEIVAVLMAGGTYPTEDGMRSAVALRLSTSFAWEPVIPTTWRDGRPVIVPKVPNS